MFLFGKSKRNDTGALRSGTIEKTPSRMIAVPQNEDSVAHQEDILARLHDTDEIKILSRELPVRVTYKDCEYEVDIADVGLSAEPDDPALGGLSEEEAQQLLAASHAPGTEMIFSDNNADSFHLQLKLMHMLVPDMAALIDDSTYRMFSGKWVAMTAESHIPPSPNYMFTVHAVNGGEGGKSVWLHTHGLNRCGTIELEILGATPDNYDDFGIALQNMAQRLIGDNKFIDEKEPMLIGAASSDKAITVTWQRSEWALRDFPKDILGGINDRNDEHSINMGVVYLYENDDDAATGKLTSILDWEDDIKDNAIYYKTTEETERMRALALERVNYMRTIYEKMDGEKTVLIKIGLIPDEGYGFDDNQHEYIWFEANELRDNDFTATLTQDAFYVEGMVEGVQKDFTYDEIVDWRIYCEEGVFTPDNVYLILDKLTD